MNAESRESIARGRSEAGNSFGGSGHTSANIEASSLRRTRLFVWAGLTVAFVLFLAVGSVTVHTGNQRSQRARVTQVWAAKADTLPDVGQRTLLRFSYFAATVLFMAASIAGLGFLLDPFGAAEPSKPDGSFEPAPPEGVEVDSVPGPAKG